MSTTNNTAAPEVVSTALQEPLLPEAAAIVVVTDENVPINDDNIDDDNDRRRRQGTISSACFNMWSTMVGGGCLSLPLAFLKSGNALLAPILLFLTAGLSYFCFTILVHGSRWSLQSTYEGIAASALGNTIALPGCAILVFLMCFFAICGYAVLLRDMLQPLTDWVFEVHHHPNGEDATDFEYYWQSNAFMFIVALIVTPICTLKTLTALEKFGAASMGSIVLLACCVFFRSGQCLANASHGTISWRLFPESGKDVLDVLPLYISCYVCHYNIPVVLNELKEPTAVRTKRWLLITVIGSTTFYMLLGLSGSMYAMACHNGTADGNILLDFPENDPLVFLGRMCLAVTIALAFPMLTIPARDILLRSLMAEVTEDEDEQDASSAAFDEPFLDQNLVDPAPFLPADEYPVTGNQDRADSAAPTQTTPPGPSLRRRLLAAIIVFWTGVVLASVVGSIDVVWDLLGSSLSILLSYLIPAASFLVLVRSQRGMGRSKALSYAMFVLFVPLMFISTGNAIINTFS